MKEKSDRLGGGGGGDESSDRNEMQKVLAVMSSESSTCDALPSLLFFLLCSSFFSNDTPLVSASVIQRLSLTVIKAGNRIFLFLFLSFLPWRRIDP